MKKIIYSAVLAVIAFACADKDYESAFREYVGINPSGVPTKVAENSAGVGIPLVFGGNTSVDKDVVVNYTIDEGTLGKYGVNYEVVGGTGATGSFTIPAGKLVKDPYKLVVRGLSDFVFEPDVKLSITLTGASDGVAIGYPFKTTFAFTIADDDCPFEFEGDLDGNDYELPDGTTGDAAVTIHDRTATEFIMEGLGTTMIDEQWAETPTLVNSVTVKIAQGGALTIDEQPVFTTDYKGSPYEYNIVGTGQINFCDGTISFTYDIVYADGSGSVAEGLGLDEPFTATIMPVKPD